MEHSFQLLYFQGIINVIMSVGSLIKITKSLNHLNWY